jgi:hypothetical protein
LPRRIGSEKSQLGLAFSMKRSSPQPIETLEDLSHLEDFVVDKRLGQRSHAKKNRRNRHYERAFLRHVLDRSDRSDRSGVEALPTDAP